METVPEKPFDKQRRYMDDMNLPYSITSALCPDLTLCQYFEETASLTKDPRKVGNWVVNDLLRELSAMEEKDTGSLIDCSPVTPARLAELINLIEDGVVSNNVAKELFPEMFLTGKSPSELVSEKGLEVQSDQGEIESICSQAIANDPDASEKFRGGKDGAINALKGFVMKATRGQANPKVVDEILRHLLSK
jgi:aspartyl-tRNA(Asn)/glutamyl-tRNA(Gln) amidotransferase subunit B